VQISHTRDLFFLFCGDTRAFSRYERGSLPSLVSIASGSDRASTPRHRTPASWSSASRNAGGKKPRDAPAAAAFAGQRRLIVGAVEPGVQKQGRGGRVPNHSAGSPGVVTPFPSFRGRSRLACGCRRGIAAAPFDRVKARPGPFR
jgi:hypothetical protein